MKRTLGVSDHERSRTRPNLGGNSSALDCGQAQDDQGPDARERQDLPSLLQALAVAVPARAPLVKFQPALAPRKPEDFKGLGLTPALWGVILKLLDHADLSRVMQSCRGLYHYGDDANATRRPDPQSALARMQRKTSRKCLDAELQKYSDECERLNAHANLGEHARTYAQTLHDLASRLHCVELVVWRGFEDGVLEALCMATRWQSAHIHIGKLVDAGWLRRLESALRAQGRICRIELHIDDPLDRPEFLPSGTGLLLDGLHLTNVEYDCMEPFRGLLESVENGMHTLSLSGEEEPDAVLPWLVTGCPNLVKLHVDDGPRDPKLLIDVLQSKAALTDFGLSNACFTTDELTVKDLLSALPKLQVWRLNSVSFGPGSGGGCTEVFRRCDLRELSIMACLLEEPKGDEKWDSIAAAHQDFCLGLSQAPHLQVLNIDSYINLHGKGPSMHVILGAFLSNPAARVLRCTEPDRDPLRRRLDKANQLRAEKQFPKVELEVKSGVPQLPAQTGWALDLSSGEASRVPATGKEADRGEQAESSGSENE